MALRITGGLLAPNVDYWCEVWNDGNFIGSSLTLDPPLQRLLSVISVISRKCWAGPACHAPCTPPRARAFHSREGIVVGVCMGGVHCVGHPPTTLTLCLPAVWLGQCFSHQLQWLAIATHVHPDQKSVPTPHPKPLLDNLHN